MIMKIRIDETSAIPEVSGRRTWTRVIALAFGVVMVSCAAAAAESVTYISLLHGMPTVIDLNRRTVEFGDSISKLEECPTSAEYDCIAIGNVLRLVIPTDPKKLRGKWEYNGNQYELVRPLSAGAILGLHLEYCVVRSTRTMSDGTRTAHDLVWSPTKGLIAQVSRGPKGELDVMFLASERGILPSEHWKQIASK